MREVWKRGIVAIIHLFRLRAIVSIGRARKSRE